MWLFLNIAFSNFFFAKPLKSRIFPITTLEIFFWPVALLYFQEKINEIDQQIKAKESEINTLKDEAASLKTEQQEIVLELQERKKAVKDKQVDIIFAHRAITRSIRIPPLLRKCIMKYEIIQINILFLSESLKKWIHRFSIFIRIFPTGFVK